MSTCPFCGATGQNEVFCDGCGALLPVASPSESAAEQATAAPALTEPILTEPTVTEPAPAEQTLPGQVPAAPTLAERERDTIVRPDPQAAGQATPGAGLQDTSPWDTGGSSAPRQDAVASGFPDDVRLRASPLVVPVAGPSQPAEAPRVAPVLPGVPDPARPSVRLPGTDDVATGPPCPWCLTPNPLGRHFCRRCAMSLATRPDPAHLPWWRRLFTWFRRFGARRRELPYAGQRPRLRRGHGRLVRWAIFAIVVGLAAFAADTWAGAAVTNVKDHFAHRYPVFPTTFTASHQDPAHPVADLHDGYNNTWWGTGVAGDGAGVYVGATFDQPINLLDIMITPGAGIEPDAFTSQSRPESIKVTLTSASGSSTSTTIALNDSPGPETFAIQGSGVTSVRLTMEAAYPAQSTSPTEVAIAEIEFFASSGGG